MASAKNSVISGTYNGFKIKKSSNGLIASSGLGGTKQINKKTVKQYELITEETMKSGTSAILRGMAGVAVLGGVGVLAGLSAKNKGIYTVAILWDDDRKSLIEIDDKLYKEFIKQMF